MAALEQRLTDHETQCLERLGQIKATGESTLKAVQGLQARSWMLVIAVLGWALVSLWSANNDRIGKLEEKPAAVAAK